MYNVLVPNGILNSVKASPFGIRVLEMQLFETCKFTTFIVQNGIPNSTKRVSKQFCGLGRSKTSPAGPPGQPGRQCRPVGLAGRRASLAAPGPAGCDLQLLQLAAGSGRGGEGGGRADNTPPPLLSPQVGYLVCKQQGGGFWLAQRIVPT